MSFSFLIMVLMVDSFILKQRATTAADLSLQHISTHSAFSCNVMTFICLLGALPASLVALCMGPVVLLQVYSNRLTTGRKMQEITFYNERSLFTHLGNLLEKQNAHVKEVSVTQHFKRILITQAHHSSSRRWLSYYSSTICKTANFMWL